MISTGSITTELLMYEGKELDLMINFLYLTTCIKMEEGSIFMSLSISIHLVDSLIAHRLLLETAMGQVVVVIMMKIRAIVIWFCGTALHIQLVLKQI